MTLRRSPAYFAPEKGLTSSCRHLPGDAGEPIPEGRLLGRQMAVGIRQALVDNQPALDDGGPTGFTGVARLDHGRNPETGIDHNSFLAGSADDDFRRHMGFLVGEPAPLSLGTTFRQVGLNSPGTAVVHGRLNPTELPVNLERAPPHSVSPNIPPCLGPRDVHQVPIRGTPNVHADHRSRWPRR